MSDYKPFNQESDPRYNQEPGIILVPGSPYLKEVAKFEQFDGPRTAGTGGPGNPYTYRPFPKMLYRAHHFNGKVCCMAAPPNAWDFKDPRELERAEIAAARFTESCQRIVKNQAEMTRAFEDGWRESPDEAVAFVLERDRKIADETAQRQYQDRNMSEAAKREVEEVVEASGGEHQPEITGQAVAEARDEQRQKGRPRRGRPRRVSE